MYVIVNPYYRSVEIDGEEVKEDFATFEDPEGSGLYPSFVGRMVVIQQ